jgi:hypothetical protein
LGKISRAQRTHARGVCIGGVPAISYVAARKLAYEVDEFAVPVTKFDHRSRLNHLSRRGGN